MWNALVGPLAAAIAIACVGAAYAAWRAGKARWSLFFIVCAGFVLRVYMGADHFLHPWDERYHALVAKHLIAHPFLPTLYDSPALPYDYRTWLGNHVWLHKPPLAPWAAAGSMALFGVNETALRLPSLITSTLAIVLTYQIGLWLFGARSALLAALFHAGNGLLVGFAAGSITSDHVDNLFIVLIELGVVMALVWARNPRRRFAALIGVVVGLAVLTKLWAALVVIPIVLCLGWRQRPPKVLAVDVGVVLLAAAAIVAPWQMYVHHAFPQEAAWEAMATFRHLVEPIEGQPTSSSYYLLRVPSVFGELLYVPLLWFFFRAIRGGCSSEEWALAIWILLPVAGFSLAVSKSVSYMAIAAPAAFLIQAEFLNRLAGYTLRPGWQSVVRWAAFALLLVLPLRFAGDRLNPFHPREREPDWAVGLRALSGQLSESVVLFGTDHPIEAMFSTRCTAYAFLPSDDQIQIVRSQGRAVAVCDDGRLRADLAADPNVLKVPCRQ